MLKVRLSAWLLSAALVLWFGLAVPAKAQSTASLAKYAPSKDLLVYAEFDGINAHEPALKKWAGYKLLNNTTLGSLIKDLAHQAIEGALKNVKGDKPAVDEVDVLLDHLVRQGFLFAVFGPDPNHTRFVLAIRNGAKPEFKKLVDRVLAMSSPDGPKTTARGGKTLTIIGSGKDTGTLWYEGDDLVLTATDVYDKISATITGKAEDASKNLNYLELKKPDNGFTPAGLVFFDVKAFPPIPPEAARLGLDRLSRVDYRLGFQDDAMVGTLRFAAPAPRQGLLTLLEQPTFDIGSLPPIPADLKRFLVFALDPKTTYEKAATVANRSSPGGARPFTAVQENLSRTLKMDFQRDFLGKIGSKWALYGSGSNSTNGSTNATLTTSITDSKTFGKAIDPLMALLNNIMAAQAQAAVAQRRPGATGKPAEFRKGNGASPSYTLVFSPGVPLPESLVGVKPSLIVGKDRLAIATSPTAARAAVTLSTTAKGSTWTPAGPTKKAAERLPKDLIVLILNDPLESLTNGLEALPDLGTTINNRLAAQGKPPINLSIKLDPALIPKSSDLAKYLFPNTMAVSVDAKGMQIQFRDSFPDLTSSAAVTGVLTGLLLPAVQAAREAARRAQCINNLKSIMLAMMNYEAAHQSLPARAIVNKAGTPLLSWRVAILPFIDQQELYGKFHLDEPWDSPHNMALLNEMPTTYRCPSAPLNDPALTNYQVFDGPGTLLETSRGVKLTEITDGTSTTLSVVESRRAVPWTKPEDIPFNSGRGVNGGSAFHPGVFNAAFADGTVRTFKASIDPSSLGKMITRAGGEPVDPIP